MLLRTLLLPPRNRLRRYSHPSLTCSNLTPPLQETSSSAEVGVQTTTAAAAEVADSGIQCD